MIDEILTAYFEIIPVNYLFIILSFGIMTILVYALYNFVDD
jgi:hypothetical protein